jgi:GNAT superfamily N-acetyltransferase
MLLAHSEAPPARPESSSWRWLRLDWGAHLPWPAGGLSIEYGSFDEALPFVRAHYPAIFGPPSPDWTTDPLTPAKRRFLESADLFTVRDGDLTVGLIVAEPSDWSTYYLRSVALLPEYRGTAGGRLLREFTRRLAEVAAEVGIERIEGDIAPANTVSMLSHIRLGYVATGSYNSDRWGSLVRLTMHIDSASDSVYRKQFCAGSWPRCRGAPPRAERSS